MKHDNNNKHCSIVYEFIFIIKATLTTLVKEFCVFDNLL